MQKKSNRVKSQNSRVGNYAIVLFSVSVKRTQRRRHDSEIVGDREDFVDERLHRESLKLRRADLRSIA